MKNTLIPLLFIVSIIISAGFSKAHSYKGLNKRKRVIDTPDNEIIVGTWILDNDSSATKFVFPDAHTCNKYLLDTLFETDIVIISNTSPQCGIIVPVDAHSDYMQLINKADKSKHYCYQIFGLSDSLLSFRPVDFSHPMSVFHKQH